MRRTAEELLRNMLGSNATFHPHQFEAIESVLSRKRTLVVQRTGWGKSVVYFIATRILRDQGAGLTILISPLLSLMRNQIESAARIGIKAETLNSENPDDWGRVEDALMHNQCDILIVSPERLANDRFRRLLVQLSQGIALFVVDEAHCISNWGHDFRPDYKRIVSLLSYLPPHVPVLATTATANDRVIVDVQAQLGSDLNVIRGPLTRESLRIQTIRLASQAERLAWLSQNVPLLEGSGIIYCLTVSDCKKVAKWLRYKGIDAQAYYGRVAEEEGLDRSLLEHRLINNEIKVLVATDALGMGFDKPDLAFVIHFQRPGSIVAYYQQIGRAGRGLDDALAILLTGEEDVEIQDYFINAAFPSEDKLATVLETIENSNQAVSINGIMSQANMSKSKVEQCLKLLEIDNLIVKQGSGYIRTPNPWVPSNLAVEVTQQRYYELARMEELCNTEECYMRFIARELNDYTAENCEKCENCLNRQFVSSYLQERQISEAVQFLCAQFLTIKPRKMWPAGGVEHLRGRIPELHQNLEGRALALYGDSGWGKYVKEDRYTYGAFRPELISAAADFIRNQWKPQPAPEWVTSVPSLRHPTLVDDFARKLAAELRLPYFPQITKIQHTTEQKAMRNSSMQVKNIVNAFSVNTPCPAGNVLLVDDIMNSGWTFTMCGMLLRQAGSGAVYPFALAATVGGSDID